MRLVLFDIDGTLVDCGRQVRPLFAGALQEVYGTSGDVDRYDFAGKTDRRIVLDLIGGAGLPAERVLAGLGRLHDLYLGRLDAGLRRDGMRVMPGVAGLLERLAARADTLLGLLTGNWERGARIKLSRVGLERFFGFGAFGDDGVDRRELPPVALARAARIAGRRFAPEETLIVGDSLQDVECGRAHGVPVLAVATGWTPASALEAAGASWVVPDLTAAGELLEPMLA